MTIWQCDVCFDEIEEPDAVCHHCGRILCDKQDVCRFIVDDDAFSDPGVFAFHCPNCIQEHREGKE
jgi:hypothetical protein